ncbi:MAG: hypothetical protein V2A34_03530 [Lentisphaerota bacterium]
MARTSSLRASYILAAVMTALAASTCPGQTEAAGTSTDESVQEAFELNTPPESPAKDPFWPADYSPQSTQVVSHAVKTAATTNKIAVTLNAEQQKDAIMKRISVKGIMTHGTNLFAIVNDQMVRQGEIMDVKVDGTVYRYMIKSLTKDNIVLEPVTDSPKPSL